MSWKSFYKNTSLANDTDPNSSPPALSGSSQPFVSHDDSQAPASGGLLLATDGTVAGDTVTVNIWLKDEAVAGEWIVIKSSLTVAHGTAQFVSFPANAQGWIQVTSKAGSPVALRAGWTY